MAFVLVAALDYYVEADLMTKDDATWLNVAYGAFAICVAFVAWKSFQTAGVHYGWLERFDSWFPLAIVAGSTILGLGAAVFLRTGSERHDYFLSAIGEMHKVSWPSWTDTKRMTAIVCVVVFVFAIILDIFDYAWANALKLLIA